MARLQGEVESAAPRRAAARAWSSSVPLSISTQRLLLVSCRGQTFALPVHAIEQLLRVKLQDVETVEGKPMLLVAGAAGPAADAWPTCSDMAEADVQRRRRAPARRGPALGAAAPGRGRGCLPGGARQRSSRTWTVPPPRSAPLAGGILLEDGSVALVLNPAELLDACKPADRAADAADRGRRAADKKPPTVLVVDDSLTTRTLEKSILEAHGYQVRIAMDGVEALAQLRDRAARPGHHRHPDAAAGRLRAAGGDEEGPAPGQLPVIVVTSMEQREDQERGLALGADAYIVKRKFDHQELLETIRQII